MSNFRFLLIVPLLIISLSVPAEICRWVDSDGTVHYADECPEGVEGSEVRLDSEPTAEQVRAAQDASQQRQLAKQPQEDAQTEPTLESAGPNSVDAKICIDAELAVDTLERPLPVYFDNARDLHHARSKHSAIYQGERDSLNDAERKKELARARYLISQHCGESKSDIIQQSDN